MKNNCTIRITTLVAVLAGMALPVHADNKLPKNAQFEAECGTCHLPFPPPLLDANSWQAVMNGLPQHFGSDASLDPKQRVAISNYLTTNAGSRRTEDASGKPQLRISETTRFIRNHHEINRSVWLRPSIKSASNCAACHPRAAVGDFEEHDVRIPR